MTLRLLAASLTRRFRQLALILAAVALAAATVAALVSFSLRAREGLGTELAAFGPNLTVRPQVGGPARLPAAEAERIREIPGVETVAAVTEGRAPGVVRFEVRAGRERLAEVAAAVEARVAGAEARPLNRVSVSEAALVRRLTLLLEVFAGVSLLLALISVGAATAALVEERRKEVGLFLALGYTDRRVAGIFAAELLAAGLAAALAGELAGEWAAARLAVSVLGAAGSSPTVTAAALAASAAAAVLVVAAAMGLTLRRFGRLDTARVLRGM
jgi:putative ABC transport system permease protein